MTKTLGYIVVGKGRSKGSKPRIMASATSLTTIREREANLGRRNPNLSIKAYAVSSIGREPNKKGGKK